MRTLDQNGKTTAWSALTVPPWKLWTARLSSKNKICTQLRNQHMDALLVEGRDGVVN